MESDKAVLLQNTLDLASRVSSVCSKALSGVPLSVACKERGLDTLEFRRFAFYGNDAKTSEKKKEVSDALLSGAERLLKEVCGSVPEYNILEFSESYKFVTSQLTDRERKVLDLYFMEDYTLDMISRDFNVSRERIRLIIGKAIRKLRYHTRKKALIEGISALSLSDSIRQKQSDLHTELERIETKVLKASNDDLDVYGLFVEDDLDVLREQGICTAHDLMGYIAKVLQDDFGVSLREDNALITDESSVDILGLSTRAHNVLHRARIYTLGQLSTLSVERLRGMRNLGENTLQEILEKSRKVGIQLPDTDVLDVHSQVEETHSSGEDDWLSDIFDEDDV